MGKTKTVHVLVKVEYEEGSTDGPAIQNAIQTIMGDRLTGTVETSLTVIEFGRDYRGMVGPLPVGPSRPMAGREVYWRAVGPWNNMGVFDWTTHNARKGERDG